MGRKRLTLQDLVDHGAFDPTNFRHRRALDESTEPLDDPELEELRQMALWHRGRNDAKTMGAERLRNFADAVSGSGSR